MKYVDAGKYKKEIRHLYRASFPVRERNPLPLLYRKMRSGKVNFRAVLDENRFIGFIYVIERETFAYLYYLAITPKERGKGYGSRILQGLKRMYHGKTLTLSIENPDEEGVTNQVERIRGRNRT